MKYTSKSHSGVGSYRKEEFSVLLKVILCGELSDQSSGVDSIIVSGSEEAVGL